MSLPCVGVWLVAAGRNHVCAIQEDGSLWCWGSRLPGLEDYDSGTPLRMGEAVWRDVSCGLNRTCGIQEDGSLWCWGVGNSGRLGDDDANPHTTSSPVLIDASGWQSISVSDQTGVVPHPSLDEGFGDGFQSSSQSRSPASQSVIPRSPPALTVVRTFMFSLLHFDGSV